MILTRSAFLTCAASLLAGGVARADEAPSETVYIVDDAPDAAAKDRARLLGDAPFVTVIHARDRAATSSVAEALATTAGVQLQSLGGLGSFQTISVRGAAAGHTAVLIDGVPLARIAAVTTDLGRFSLASFGQVELYRGAVPVELGGAGVGGAVNMVTHVGRGASGERITASAGVGSYGARHVRAHYGDEHGHYASATTVGYESANGDFSFFSDNGTLLQKADDTYLTRENNRFDRVDATSRMGARDGSRTLGVRAAYQQQGLPGNVAAPTMSADLSTLDVIADGNIAVAVGPAIARQLAYVLVEKQDLSDPNGELGFGGAERTYLTFSGGASSTWHVPLADHRLAIGAELRGDRFRDSDDSARTATFTGTRVGGAVTGELAIALSSMLEVTPAMRLDVQRSAPTPMTAGPSAGMGVDERWDVVPAPRFTARAAIRDDLVLKGSVGTYARLPTLIEVFGNRGVIVGSPDLQEERGTSSDVGGVWAPAKSMGAVDRVLVQTDVFATRSRDTIVFIPTAGYAARAINLENTQSYGAELIAAARLAKLVSVTASYTRLVTEQLSSDPNLRDKPLPRKPEHLAYARADLAKRVFHREASLYMDASYQGASTLDQNGNQRVPGRVLFGAGVRGEIAAGFGLSLTVANLTDRRRVYLPLDPPPSPTFTEAPTALVDITGYPLPGRSFYLTLEWAH